MTRRFKGNCCESNISLYTSAQLEIMSTVPLTIISFYNIICWTLFSWRKTNLFSLIGFINFKLGKCSPGGFIIISNFLDTNKLINRRKIHRHSRQNLMHCLVDRNSIFLTETVYFRQKQFRFDRNFILSTVTLYFRQKLNLFDRNNVFLTGNLILSTETYSFLTETYSFSTKT